VINATLSAVVISGIFGHPTINFFSVDDIKVLLPVDVPKM